MTRNRRRRQGGGVLQDLRIALTGLRRALRFAGTARLTLGLGFGSGIVGDTPSERLDQSPRPGILLPSTLIGLDGDASFGATSDDIPAHRVVVALLVGVALLAALGPSRHAARVDPAVVLREA